MGFRFFNICLLALLSCPAQAADTLPPLNFKAIYMFDFSGLPFGKIGIEAEQDAKSYRITADIASSGLLKLFTQHSSHTTVDATNGDLVYDTHYRIRKKRRAVNMVYKNGVIVKEVVEPPDNRAKRPAVSAEMKKGASDPLTLNIRLRELVWKTLQTETKNLTIKTYDGRRLTQIDGTVLGKRTIAYGDDKKYPVIAVSLKRQLLAGFTKSEIEDYSPKEPPLYVYYSDDARMIPVRLEVSLLFGKLTATLAKECRTGESCLLGIRE